MSFAKNLRNELIYQNITCKEFSHRCGVPYSTFLTYVNYKSSLPNVELAVRFAKELGVTVEYLVTGEDPCCNTSLSPIFREMARLPPKMQEAVVQIIHISTAVAEQNTREQL